MSSSNNNSGSGTDLPRGILIAAVVCSGVSTLLSLGCIWLQLRNYRKVALQRWVVRILVMVPIYAVSSCVSLFSLDAAFFIDLVRDLYEAFVIYCFFSLLVEYLGGERSLIIMLHGRPATPHPWPVSKFIAPMDVSDPYTFLALKRGILSYVQIKPILAILTVFLKATGTYRDGQLKGDAGYTYISVAYNIFVSLSLYCLAMFWVCTHEDLKPFRPTPKFICVKGIIFFSFWQSFVISILVKAKILHSSTILIEDLSVATQDALICFEMVGFALLHVYAFSHHDYIDKHNLYAGRLPFFVALRDCLIGYKDVFQDSLTTLRGTGFSYRTFEPVEGGVHQGLGRDRRVRAGLRYVDGGKSKRWLPMPGDDAAEAYGRRSPDNLNALKHPFKEAQRLLNQSRSERRGYAPIAPEQVDSIYHEAPDIKRTTWRREYDSEDSESEASSLGFDGLDEGEERLYADSRQLEFGDYNYPVTDASKEEARRRMREEEDAIVYGRRRPKRSSPTKKGKTRQTDPPAPSTSQLPEGCVDILVEDKKAEEEVANYDRHRGDPNHLGGQTKKVFRRVGGPQPKRGDSTTGAVPEGAYIEERRESKPAEQQPAFDIGEADEEAVDDAEAVVTANATELTTDETEQEVPSSPKPDLDHRHGAGLTDDNPWKTVG